MNALKASATVQLEIVSGALEVLTTDEAIRRIQQMARKDGWQKAGSVDDFLEWQREEGRREKAEIEGAPDIALV